MRMLITGGRDWCREERNRKFVESELSRIKPESMIVGNDGRQSYKFGVDAIAWQWAMKKGVPCAVIFPAWDTFFLTAGPIRNGWMLLYGPELVVAFPGGKGTKDMKRQAEAAGVVVLELAP